MAKQDLLESAAIRLESIILEIDGPHSIAMVIPDYVRKGRFDKATTAAWRLAGGKWIPVRDFCEALELGKNAMFEAIKEAAV